MDRCCNLLRLLTGRPAAPHCRAFLLPNRPSDCYWGAVAWASGQMVAVQLLGDVALAPFVYVHELGHTLGLEHAGKGDNVYGEGTGAGTRCRDGGCR